jgi:hypothetical protein
MSIDDIKEIRGHFDEKSNDPIAKICDFLIDQFDTSEIGIISPSESTVETE